MITDLGHNLLGTALSGTVSGTGDVFSDTPLLAPLGNYGGPTQTMALLPGSPAIDAGTATGAPTTDQRGFGRVGAVDIGAFESSAISPATSQLFNTLAQAIPGGLTGGSALVGPLTQVGVDLALGNYTAAKADLDTLVITIGAEATTPGALGADPATALGTTLTLFESAAGLEGMVLAALGTPFSPVIVAAGNSGFIAQQLVTILQTIPGGLTGGSPLATDTVQAGVDLSTGNIAAAKTDFDKLASDIASAALSGQLGTNPDTALSTTLALLGPTASLEGLVLAAQGTPLSQAVVDAGNSGYTAQQFVTIVQNIPGGLTGGSPLAADVVQAGVYLTEGNMPGTVTALNSLWSDAVAAAATQGGGLTSSTLLTLLTSAGNIESLVGATPTSPSISAPTITYGAAGSVTVTVGSTGGTPSGAVTLVVNGTQWITKPLVGGAATFSLPGLNAGDYNLTAIFAAQGDVQGSSFSSGNLHVNKANATVVVTPYTVTYDGQAHTATVTSITGVNGETGPPVGTVTLNTTHTNAGTYASDSWSFTGTANYNYIASTTITDTINKASAMVVVTPYTVTYDGQAHTATVTSIAGVNGEMGATVGSVALNTTHTAAGTYSSDSWSFTGTANYNGIASTTITDTINKATLTIRANNDTKAYGTLKTFSSSAFTQTGLRSSDTITGVTLTSTGAAASAAVGSYDIVASAATGTGLSNYTITYVNGTLMVGNATSQSANFNGTTIGAGNYLWFSSVLTASGLSSTATTTIWFVNQTITIGSVVVPVPSTSITYHPGTGTSTTVFTTGGWWKTDVYLGSGLSGNQFLSGLGYYLPTSLAGGTLNVTWSGVLFTDRPGVSLNWKWAAAVYTQLPYLGSQVSSVDYNAMAIKPVDDNHSSAYQNSDHAGTPEGRLANGSTIKSHVTDGAMGGGGSNYTGGYSGTRSASPTSALDEFFIQLGWTPNG
jgi:hypothetical protein